MNGAYYNENDGFAAQWLRNLIARGLIAPGEVDARSIVDVRADELRGFSQCHFFAGIGVWSYALRLAGWRDERAVWTGSCPCGPFSIAGTKAGFDDERHLWPEFFRLIRQCRPGVVLGEQVASPNGLAWFDLVQSDMEGEGYAAAAIDLCAAGVGAPHIRQRLYWMAHADCVLGRQGREIAGGIVARGDEELWPRSWFDGSVGILVDRERAGLEGYAGYGDGAAGRPIEDRSIAAASSACELANDDGTGLGRVSPARLHERRSREGGDQPAQGEIIRPFGDDADGRCVAGVGHNSGASPVNGIWRDADWLYCRDGKWRPVEASPQPLADGSAESLGRVRADIVEAIEKEIDGSALESQMRRPETVRALRDRLAAQAGQVWTAGRLPGLHEAPFLLAFLRQLAEQGWPIAQGVSLSRAEIETREVRGVRGAVAAPRSPRQRELEGQCAGECADAMHLLSSILARHAQKAWADSYAAHAEIGFPIGHNSRSRVGRLRGYGNAIVAPLAKEFIEAVMEALP